MSQEQDRIPCGVVLQHDLASGPLPSTFPEARFVLYVLLRWKGRPVGRLLLDPLSPLDREEIERLALEASAAGILAAQEAAGQQGLLGLVAHRPAVPAGLDPLSVVVATRDRPDDLAHCLASLRRLDPAPGEIIVVDSASRDPGPLREIASAAEASLLRLDRAGLSRARNAGAAAARGDVVAFLDDDCRVDPGWLLALAEGFAHSGTDAVAGQLLPLELTTEAQVLFLRHAHMDLRGFLPRRFRLEQPVSPHWPIDSWRIGSGGNLAVRREAFARLGGFREDLGLGTEARGGEDLFFLWSVLNAGKTVVYRPDALAWHRHHSELAALKRVLFGYGVGHAAYLRAIGREGTARRRLRLYRISFHADRLGRLARSIAGVSPVHPQLVLAEIVGGLVGGILARRATRRSRAEGKRSRR